jgi:FXSXX-COOH protein
MITIEDKRSEIPSDLADLRRVALVDMPALSNEVLGNALRRLVAAPLAVPVAAFNSSI